MNLPNPNPNVHTIAFYNTENLFHYTMSLDQQVLQTSHKGWNKERYQKKIHNTAMAISRIAFEEVQKPPTLIGLSEVENDKVLADLVTNCHLQDYNYGFIHYDSPDERGLDVALLYDKDSFVVETSENLFLYIENEHGVSDYTRDILKISGYLEGEKLHVLVNHWPSRHQKSDPNGYKRKLAAHKVLEIIGGIRKDDADAKIIVMGDFNDSPKNDSIQLLAKNQALFNPMENLASYTRGSVNHNSRWMVFDQILMSSNFQDQKTMGFNFSKADIFDAKFLVQNYGNFKGYPFRTYEGKRYIGGFSDHFPVYIQLEKKA